MRLTELDDAQICFAHASGSLENTFKIIPFYVSLIYSFKCVQDSLALSQSRRNMRFEKSV